MCRIFKRMLAHLEKRNGAVAASIVESTNSQGISLLRNACLHLDRECVSLLLAKGALLEEQSVVDNSTCLHASVSRIEIVRCLLDYIEEHYSEIKHRKRFIDSRDSTGNTALHLACATGNLDTAKALLEHGADPTLANDAGQTSLNIAPALLAPPVTIDRSTTANQTKTNKKSGCDACHVM